MKLQLVLDQLGTGEFSFANLGGNDEEGITSNNIKTIINHINIALIQLYTRFDLKNNEIHLQQYEHISKYLLTKEYSYSNTESDKSFKYIMDTEDTPYVEDILQIVGVYDELGCQLPLNDSAYCNSLYTPTYNTLQIPCPVNENSVSIIYRASPDLLDSTSCNKDQDVPIPIAFLEPLLMYVAYRFHASKSSIESISESNNYLTKFNALCDTITLKGIYNTTFKTNTKLTDRGFV